MNKKIRAIGAAILVVVWVALTGFAWFSPAKDISAAERRPLDQFPELSVETLLNGKFMSQFEDYTLDQFPARDTFRQLKSLYRYYAMQQLDNNDIYIADGYAAKLEYPLNSSMVSKATGRLNYVYETYLKNSGSTVFSCVVPDKGYYLAEANGYLSMDYDALFSQVQAEMPWATHVDITDCLTIEDYYYTDTHWRQERILGVAQKLSQAMGVTAPKAEDFNATKLDRPFYGVYYGQAALPMSSEDLYIMESELLSQCRVFNYENNTYLDVYDMAQLTSRDLYDVYLSGPKSILRIENPNAKTDRELIVFRDSFGSSLTPLLVQDYATVTLVDLRYVPSNALSQFIDFNGQDVLMLYSTIVLNSVILK
jgi:hypothetical protein